MALAGSQPKKPLASTGRGWVRKVHIGKEWDGGQVDCGLVVDPAVYHLGVVGDNGISPSVYIIVIIRLNQLKDVRNKEYNAVLKMGTDTRDNLRARPTNINT